MASSITSLYGRYTASFVSADIAQPSVRRRKTKMPKQGRQICAQQMNLKMDLNKAPLANSEAQGRQHGNNRESRRPFDYNSLFCNALPTTLTCRLTRT